MIDLEYRGFKWVERHGCSSVYTSNHARVSFEAFNHPQLAAQRVTYGEMMRWLATAIDGGMLGSSFRVLRGRRSLNADRARPVATTNARPMRHPE